MTPGLRDWLVGLGYRLGYRTLCEQMWLVVAQRRGSRLLFCGRGHLGGCRIGRRQSQFSAGESIVLVYAASLEWADPQKPGVVAGAFGFGNTRLPYGFPRLAVVSKDTQFGNSNLGVHATDRDFWDGRNGRMAGKRAGGRYN
jgi:hypothetical protein